MSEKSLDYNDQILLLVNDDIVLLWKPSIKDFLFFCWTFVLRDSNDIGESDRRKQIYLGRICIVADPGESPLVDCNSTKETCSPPAVSQDSPA
jgi:hypothetical protein